MAISGNGEEQPIAVSQVTIHRQKVASAFYLWWNKMIPLGFILGALWLILYWCRICTDTCRKTKQLLTIITLLLLCIPLFLDYIPSGVDLQIHLNRLEGLAQGIKSGQLPVRMHSSMWNNYSYPFGVFYGDLFYYIPAILYLLGLPLWRAYRLYLVMIIIATVFIADYSFDRIIKLHYNGKISNSETLDNNFIFNFGSIIVSFVYSFGIWHLTVLFGRAAVGAYTAYTFIPLILLGTWELLRETTNLKFINWRCITHLSLGFAGVAISHLLSLVIIGLFFLLFIIFYFKKLIINNFKKLIQLCIAGCITLLLAAGFLVPVVYMTRVHDLYISNFSFHLQQYGVYISQLFMTDYNVTGLAVPLSGAGEDWPQTMGLALIFAGIIALYLIISDKASEYKETMLMLLGLSTLSTFMSSNLCPYDWIQEKLPWMYKILGRVQTSNRYLLAAVVLLTALFLIVLLEINEIDHKIALYVAIVVSGIALWQGIKYESKYIFEASMVSALSNDDAGIVSYSNDYLYLFNDSDYERVFAETKAIAYDDVIIQGENYINNGYELTVENGAQTGYIDIPLFNYVGYDAYDNAGNRIDIMDGDNHKIQLCVPAGFNGSIRINYKEPILWRIAELASLITLLAIILINIRRRVTNSYDKSKESFPQTF